MQEVQKVCQHHRSTMAGMASQPSNPTSSDVYLLYSTTNMLQHNPINTLQQAPIQELHYGPRRAYRNYNAAAHWCRTTLLQYLQWPVNAQGYDPLFIGPNLWKTGGHNSVSGRSASFIIERRQSFGALPSACTDLYLVCEETSHETHVEDGYVPGIRRLHCMHDVVVLEFYPDMMTASGYREFEDSRHQGRPHGVAGDVVVKRVPVV